MVTCKELILKEGDGEIRTFYDLQAEFSYSSSVSLLCLLSHWLPEALGQSRCIPTRSSIRSSRTPGHVLRRPRRQRVVLDQGLGGARCPWIPETGVQKYIGCRTRPHGGGSGEGG